MATSKKSGKGKPSSGKGKTEPQNPPAKAKPVASVGSNVPGDIFYRTATQHKAALEKGEYSAVDLSRSYLERSQAKKDLEIYLRMNEESILKAARESDERRAAKKLLGPMDGIPVAIKDNILIQGEKTTCASRILENFVAPYNATVIEKLKASGAILFGQTNMDEFAMGSSTENSAFQITKNPWNATKVPGGSSGGSAAAVAASTVPLSLGSDTGGSIRQPASLCGIVGLKPTYGRVSRYGLVAFASSLDQIGPFAKSVEDAALLMSVLNGYDKRDSTSHPDSEKKRIEPDVKRLSDVELKKLRVGLLMPDGAEGVFEKPVIESIQKSADYFRSKGATVVELKSRLWKYVIPIYYILATAEASSNLSRYDGVRYGFREKEAKNLLELYVKSRTEGFGPEVKRRILLGTFVLSSGYYDAYYHSAQRARRIQQLEYEEHFKSVDVILQATSPTTAFGIGEKASNPLAMYQSDLLTISVNLGGVPAMSIPAGLDEKGLPIGIQLTGNYFDENRLFQIGATMLDQIPGFTLDYSKI